MKDDEFSYEAGGDCCSPVGRQGRMTMGRDGKVTLPSREPAKPESPEPLRPRVPQDQPKAEV